MLRKYCSNSVAAMVLMFGGASSLFAQTDELRLESDYEATHSFHPNLLAVFVGVTHEGRNENEPALGIEYERRLSASFGVGALVEHTFGALDFWVYAVQFAYHTGRWKLYVAPGVENGENGNEALVRFGGEYAYEFKDWEIAPQIDVDFVGGEEVVVLGVTFGKGF